MIQRQPFKNQYTRETRIKERHRLSERYPAHIPVICECHNIGEFTIAIKKKKYLVPFDLTVRDFMSILKKQLKILPSESLIISIDGNVIASDYTMLELSYEYPSEDGFLYIEYSKEATFG